MSLSVQRNVLIVAIHAPSLLIDLLNAARPVHTHPPACGSEVRVGITKRKAGAFHGISADRIGGDALCSASRVTSGWVRGNLVGKPPRSYKPP